jgi:hypothetical protein
MAKEILRLVHNNQSIGYRIIVDNKKAYDVDFNTISAMKSSPKGFYTPDVFKYVELRPYRNELASEEEIALGIRAQDISGNFALVRELFAFLTPQVMPENYGQTKSKPKTAILKQKSNPVVTQEHSMAKKALKFLGYSKDVMWKDSKKAAKKYCEDLGFEMNVRSIFNAKRGDWSAYGNNRTIMVYHDDIQGRLEFHVHTRYASGSDGWWSPVAYYSFEDGKFNDLRYSLRGEDETYDAHPEDFSDFFDVSEL